MWTQPSPHSGRKILQYCLENLGGCIFKCFELTSQATRKGPKPNSTFDDKDDKDIDEELRNKPWVACRIGQSSSAELGCRRSFSPQRTSMATAPDAKATRKC